MIFNITLLVNCYMSFSSSGTFSCRNIWSKNKILKGKRKFNSLSGRRISSMPYSFGRMHSGFGNYKSKSSQ